MSTASVILILISALSNGGDSPQWSGFRGNNGSGVSSAEELPDALDPELNLIWRTEILPGYSSPAVAGKDLYLTGSSGTKLVTLCLDAYSGEVRWQKEVDFDGKRPGQNSPAAPTPAADGEHVFVLFHSVGLIAYDKAGKELWRKPLGPFNIPHGMASSPVLHEDLVVLQIDQDVTPYVAAFDKKTGAEKWKIDRPGVAHGYATPAVFAPEKGPAQVITSSSFQIAGYALDDGRKLWWVDGAAWQTKCVPVIEGNLCFVNSFMGSPTEFGVPRLSGTFAELMAERDADGDMKLDKSEWDDENLHMLWFLFDLDDDDVLDEEDWNYAVSTGRATGGLFAIELGGGGDVTKTNVKWLMEDRRGLPDAPSPLVYGGTIFLIKEGGILTALDAFTGAVLKQDRVGSPDDYYASPVAGDGKLYLASRSGQLSVVTAERDWKQLSVHDIEEEIWSTPALAGRAAYVRSQKALYCFESPQD